MSAISRGKPIYFSEEVADASTANQILLYEAGVSTSGGATALTLAATERLVITEVIVVTNTAADVKVFLNEDNDGTVDAGEIVVAGDLAANGGIAKSFVAQPRMGALGANLYVSSSAAANVHVNGTGYIVNG